MIIQFISLKCKSFFFSENFLHNRYIQTEKFKESYKFFFRVITTTSGIAESILGSRGSQQQLYGI